MTSGTDTTTVTFKDGFIDAGNNLAILTPIKRKWQKPIRNGLIEVDRATGNATILRPVMIVPVWMRRM
jgi:hypothetical protein